MKAIIMAGGEGTRLRPMTCTMPKPMARVMNKPVMEHIINLLKKYNITEIGVTLMYMPNLIKDYFGDGSAFGVKLTYFTDETPLGTAGSIKNAAEFLDDDFLVISGDALCNIDIDKLISFHKEKNAEATLVLKSMEIPIEYGVVIINSDNKVVRFLEKPVWSQVFSDTVNTGIYVLSPNVLHMIDNLPSDFSKDVFPGMLSENKAIYGFVTDGYWCDIGDIDAYRHCHFDIFDKKLDFDMGISEKQPGIFIHDCAKVEDGAVLHEPIYIGAGSHIKRGAVIDAYTVIGENTLVCENASIKRSIVYSGTIIGKAAQVRGAVICDKSVIRENACVFEQAVIGEGSVVGDGACVKPSVKIWPSKTVEPGITQSANLVWGNSGNSDLFGERGICGEVNVEITPEFAGKLGTAIGSFYEKGKIGLSYDGSGSAGMIKNSLESGLLSAGAHVFDFGDQPLPITRAGICVYGLNGGIHIGAMGHEKCEIDILDKSGANFQRADEKKLKSILNAEKFKRVEAGAIGDITKLHEYKLYYLREIINPIKNMSKKYKLLFAVSSEWGSKIIAEAANELECDIKIINTNIDFNDKNALKKFSDEVIKDGYDLGAVLDSSCENMILFDEKGRMQSSDKYKALAALLVMKKYKGATIYATVSAPSVIEQMANDYGSCVERTRESPLELMGSLCNKSDDAEKEQFVLYFDAVGAVIKILDFINENDCTLSSVIDEIPTFFIIRKEAQCGFEDKGRVIRQLIDETDRSKLKTIDGVDISEDKGRVLIIPDSVKPVCNIMSESYDEEYAESLAEIYFDKISEQEDKGL